MTAEHAADALRRLADDDGQIRTNTLPPEVSARMQWVADHREHECVHVALAHDLPPGAVGKLCVQGVPLVWCAANPTCTVEAVQTIAAWPGARIDTSCSLCSRAQTRYRVMWTDQAAGLSMCGWVCTGCASKLASLVGLP